MSGLQVVWFKRDLRVADHAPLAAAARCGPVLPLYVLEPGYWAQPDTAERHWAFIRESLASLDEALRRLGLALHLAEGAVTDMLARLHAAHGIAAVHAHEETGNAWTYARYRAVRAWCREHRAGRVLHPESQRIRQRHASRSPSPRRPKRPVAPGQGRLKL